MYIESVPNRSSPPAILLRESYREGDKVKKRTLANLTHWPKGVVEGFRRLLRDEALVSPDDLFDIVRSLPHGHVAAVVGTLRRLQLDKFIGSRRSRERDLVVAMIAERILAPRSKLATARGLAEETAADTLGNVLSLESVDEDELYEAMDWLLPRQNKIEAALAARHLEEGTLALYDATSTWFEGRTCPLGKLGHPKADGKKGRPQIVIGLLCAPDGCPVSIELFEGNTSEAQAHAHNHRSRSGRQIRRRPGRLRLPPVTKRSSSIHGPFEVPDEHHFPRVQHFALESRFSSYHSLARLMRRTFARNGYPPLAVYFVASHPIESVLAPFEAALHCEHPEIAFEALATHVAICSAPNEPLVRTISDALVRFFGQLCVCQLLHTIGFCHIERPSYTTLLSHPAVPHIVLFTLDFRYAAPPDKFSRYWTLPVRIEKH